MLPPVSKALTCALDLPPQYESPSLPAAVSTYGVADPSALSIIKSPSTPCEPPTIFPAFSYSRRDSSFPKMGPLRLIAAPVRVQDAPSEGFQTVFPTTVVLYHSAMGPLYLLNL